jgi:hypothetical protein
MSRFGLLHDAKMALNSTVDLDDLVSALFNDNPDLISFEVNVTNEYDDNNYSDYSRLTKINGYSVDYNGEYDEDYEDEEENDLPKASQESIEQAMEIPEFVADKFGHGEHSFLREDYENSRDRVIDKSDTLCAIALLKGEKVPVDTIANSMERWILHHAEVHGRYSSEDEYRLLAREEMMGIALAYAKKHGPLSEKTLNYFILSLKSEDWGYNHLQEYLEWMKGESK